MYISVFNAVKNNRKKLIEQERVKCPIVNVLAEQT